MGVREAQHGTSSIRFHRLVPRLPSHMGPRFKVVHCLKGYVCLIPSLFSKRLSDNIYIYMCIYIYILQLYLPLPGTRPINVLKDAFTEGELSSGASRGALYGVAPLKTKEATVCRARISNRTQKSKVSVSFGNCNRNLL